MNIVAMPSAMLAIRAALRRADSLLPNRAKMIWEEWIDTRRYQTPLMTSPRIVVVITITTVEDIYLHIGAMQILAAPELRSTIVLHVPNSAVGRIIEGQASRQGWLGLVHIAVGSQANNIMARLNGETRVAVFTLPRPLPGRDIATLPENSKYDEGFYVGYARDYSVPADKGKTMEATKVIECIDLMLNANPDVLTRLSQKEYSPCASARLYQQLPNVIAQDRITIDLPEPGEIIVKTSAKPPQMCLRQDSDLQLESKLRVRLPPSLIKLDGQELRIEFHSHDGAKRTNDILARVPPANLKPWMITAYLNRGGGGNPLIRAFARGIGCRLAYAEDEPQELSNIPIVWGVLRDSDRIVAQANRQGLPFFYMDHAYFDRGHGKSYRITRNRYEAGPIRECPDDRIANLDVEIRPWNKRGRDIIVCPPTEYFMQAHGCADWLETTLEKLRRVTGRPIVIRKKPAPGESIDPLPQALENAHALVTHSSNVAIEAVCLGTPVFVAPSSAAAPVGRFNIDRIETPYYPDRRDWLAHLAYNQFTLEEIARGEAWRLLLELEERPFV